MSGNYASGSGGGLFNTKRGTTTIINCTISGNTAAAGGGLYNAASANLSACTIAGNSATVGGGIDNEPAGVATLEDTIVAANTATGGFPSDIGGNNPSGVGGTYDLVGTGGAGGLAGGTGNIVLTNLDGLGLAPLGNYGGPTQTMPLLPGSAAIATGTVIAGLSTDQRGVAVAASPDIGAFQSQGFVLTVVPDSTPQATATDTEFANPLAVTVTAIDPIEPVEGGVVSYSANPAQNGASANLSATTAIIGASGIAQVTATANSTAGPYTVTATEAGAASPATFTLTNLVALTFSGIVSQSILVGTASATFSGTLALGVQTPQGEMVAVTLDGVTQPAAIDSAGAFSATFATAGLDVSPTPYTVSYVYTSDGTFADASTTSALTVNVNRSTPAITWARPADITYGTALSAAQLDATASVPGTVHLQPTHRRRPECRHWTDTLGHVHSYGHDRLHHRFRLRDDQRRQGHAHHHLGQPRRHHLRHRALGHPARCHIVMDSGRRARQRFWDVHIHSGRGYGPVRRPGTDPLGRLRTLRLDRLQPSLGHGVFDRSAHRRPGDHPVHGRSDTVQIGGDLTYTIVVINKGPSPATAVMRHQPAGDWRELCQRFGDCHSFGDCRTSRFGRRGQPWHTGPGGFGHGDIHGGTQRDRNADRLGQRDVERDRYQHVEQHGQRDHHRGRSGGNHRVQFDRTTPCRRTPARPPSP